MLHPDYMPLHWQFLHWNRTMWFPNSQLKTLISLSVHKKHLLAHQRLIFRLRDMQTTSNSRIECWTSSKIAHTNTASHCIIWQFSSPTENQRLTRTRTTGYCSETEKEISCQIIYLLQEKEAARDIFVVTHCCC